MIQALAQIKQTYRTTVPFLLFKYFGEDEVKPLKKTYKVWSSIGYWWSRKTGRQKEIFKCFHGGDFIRELFKRGEYRKNKQRSLVLHGIREDDIHCYTEKALECDQLRCLKRENLLRLPAKEHRRNGYNPEIEFNVDAAYAKS